MTLQLALNSLMRAARPLSALALRVLALALLALPIAAHAQSFATTSVQGTVYLAGGAPATGTVQISWPAFTTAAGQAVAAGRTALPLGRDGFLSVALAANQGATPAGLYYTVVLNLSDGSAGTEYWTVPAAAQAALASVRAQVMPSAQAIQAVSKSYVDGAVSQIAKSQMSSGGGTLTGPLFLAGDPASINQAANKHYVDHQFTQALPHSGGVASGPLTATQLGGVYQVDQMPGSDIGAQLQSCLNLLANSNGGSCDARNYSGPLSMASNLSIAAANVTIQLPCATISTAASILIAPGTRNVTLHGCASRGTSAASGSQGGTVFAYSGASPFFQIGDPAYATDTNGFHLDNAVVNTTASSSAAAQPLAAWRTQEMNLQSLYLLGNANQAGITLDGTGNYTGGTFQDVQLTGFLTAVNAIGHQVANAAPTDWLNASTFVRLHIDCPTAGGNPIAGATGINLAQGDGNTFTGGDIEGCAVALHLGPNAQNNTIIGLRTENSTSQVIADSGSRYNNWISGGTMFTGQLTDNGTRNSFMDTFHRSFNSLNGDWFGSQQDSTLTNHYRLGIGSGNERGLLTRYQTDSGYRWTTGLSDASAGAQFYQVLDELNSVYRLSIGQYNAGQPSTNNQTVLNAAGTGAIVLNGSSNSGTGGVVFGAGGSTGATVATVDKAGNAQLNGGLLVGGTSQSAGTLTVRNNADAEVDYYLWPGLAAEQKGSFTYKDHTGNSQWHMVKDAANNWALNSATGGLDSIKAYQSNNSGDTYINASNSSGAVRVNYEAGAGSAFNIYGGGSGKLYASFTAPNSIKFPGIAASTGHNCLQIDNSGYLTNTGVDCSAVSFDPGTPGPIGATIPAAATFTTVALGSTVIGAHDAASWSQALSTVAALGSGEVWCNGAIPITSNYTLPAGVRIRAMQGCSFSVGSGVTFTLQPNSFDASPYLQVFTGPGTVLGIGRVEVPWFGAKGDGSTIDSSAFTAAKIAAGANGQVYVRSGTFPARITLDQAGQTWHILPGVILLQPPAVTGYTIAISANNVTLDGGGTLDGNLSNIPSCVQGGCYSLYASHVANLHINNLTFKNSTGGIKALCVPGYRLTNSFLYSSTSTINASLMFAGWGDAGCPDMGNIDVENNTFDTTAATNAGTVYTSQIWGYCVLNGSPCAAPSTGGTIYLTHDVVFSHNFLNKRPGNSSFGDSSEMRAVTRLVADGNISTGGNMGLSIVGGSFETVSHNVITTPYTVCLEAAGVLNALYTNNICNGGGVTMHGDWLDQLDWNNYSSGVNIVVANENISNTIQDGVNATGSGIGGGSPYANFSFNNINCDGYSGPVNGFTCIFISTAQGFSITGGTMQGGTTALARSPVYLNNSIAGSISGINAAHFKSALVTIYTVSSTTETSLAINGNNMIDVEGGLLSTAGTGTLGTSITAHNNTRDSIYTPIPDYTDYANNILTTRGTGAPAIAAGVGSQYLRLDGGSGSTLYVKESGAGTNGGWVAK